VRMLFRFRGRSMPERILGTCTGAQ
jgi:hypothetical protein